MYTSEGPDDFFDVPGEVDGVYCVELTVTASDGYSVATPTCDAGGGDVQHRGGRAGEDAERRHRRVAVVVEELAAAAVVPEAVVAASPASGSPTRRAGRRPR